MSGKGGGAAHTVTHVTWAFDGGGATKKKRTVGWNRARAGGKLRWDRQSEGRQTTKKGQKRLVPKSVKVTSKDGKAPEKKL